MGGASRQVATRVDELNEAIEEFAGQPRVLVAVDFDGTLAPLVDDPMSARALPGSVELLQELALLPDTWVAIVSGRGLGILRELTGAAGPVLLVGSHGVERSYDEGSAQRGAAETRVLAELAAVLEQVRHTHPGAQVERKPHAVVLHTRGMAPAQARAAFEAAHELTSTYNGLSVTPGKDVLELATQDVGKGPALLDLASRLGVGAIFYAGDDVTDERAFAELGPAHLTIRVGPGQSVAQHRVPDEDSVLRLLRELLRLRSAAVRGRAR